MALLNNQIKLYHLEIFFQVLILNFTKHQPTISFKIRDNLTLSKKAPLVGGMLPFKETPDVSY